MVSSDLSIDERVVAGLMVACLVAAPYLLIWLACRSLRFWLARVIMAVALAGCCLLGFYAFDQVEAQGGIYFLFAPIYQLAGTVALFVLAATFDRVWRWHLGRSVPTEADS